MRKICKLEVKNDFVVKGVHFEGVKKLQQFLQQLKKPPHLEQKKFFLLTILSLYLD